MIPCIFNLGTGEIIVILIVVLLLFGDVFFLVYDYTVGNLTDVYRDYFAPKFLRKGRR